MEDKVLKILTGFAITVRGSEVYLKKDAALEFLSKCSEKNHKVIGIELFEIEGKKIIPLLDKIYDLSDSNINNSISNAEKFILTEMGEDLYANFVIK